MLKVLRVFKESGPGAGSSLRGGLIARVSGRQAIEIIEARISVDLAVQNLEC